MSVRADSARRRPVSTRGGGVWRGVLDPVAPLADAPTSGRESGPISETRHGSWPPCSQSLFTVLTACGAVKMLVAC